MKRLSLLMVRFIGFSLALAFAAEAIASECKQVHAQITTSLTTEGCTSPVGLCTTGKVEGNRGLDGTTSFTADSLAAGPATALNAAATFSYSGILKITTEKGTLTTRDTGIIDSSTGAAPGGFFSSFDVVIGGTGRFEGATGRLFIGGETISGQLVTRVITGEICLP